MNSNTLPGRNVPSCQRAPRRCCSLSGSFFPWSSTWSRNAFFSGSSLRLWLKCAFFCFLLIENRGEGFLAIWVRSLLMLKNDNEILPSIPRMWNQRPFLFWLDGSIPSHFSSDLGQRPVCRWRMERNMSTAESQTSPSSAPSPLLRMLGGENHLKLWKQTESRPGLGSFMNKPSHFGQVAYLKLFLGLFKRKIIILLALIYLMRVLGENLNKWYT